MVSCLISAASTDEALAAFYIAQSVDIDRYCKKAVHKALQDETAAINLLNSRSRSLNHIRVLNGLYDLTSIRMFDNVPYLRRFRINGTNIITSFVRFNCTVLLTIELGNISDYLPEPLDFIVENGHANLLDDFFRRHHVP